MIRSGTYKIRPAGRLVLTIGRELIQDVHAAVLELVKNAYDADSPNASIEFEGLADRAGYSITVTDDGHGMTREDVINKWLVPSTSDKLHRRVSPSGRVMQGRKGVGRYATSMLGNDLLLETASADGEQTVVYVEWDEFENSSFLDDVEVLVETTRTGQGPGTRLTIRGDADQMSKWDVDTFTSLRYELRKLKSPLPTTFDIDNFDIILSIKGMNGIPDTINEKIEPFPIFDLFDYRIAGSIDMNGSGEFRYSIQKFGANPDEIIDFVLSMPTQCGNLMFDIRVYDRDGDSIGALIGRGLKDEKGQYVGRLEARRLLNHFNGIGVYRNGFRIRPLGDPEYDWLTLNKQRVQNPSRHIGSNQVIGVVQIESEDISGLREKSARDGLVENEAFVNLKRITTEVINLLETRRFRFRRRTGLSRRSTGLERSLQRLASSVDVNRQVRSNLSNAGVSQIATEAVVEIIERDQQTKIRIAEDLRREIAIYQGQATLGKIVDVILHDGRQPLNYFRNQIPNLRFWYESFNKTKNRSHFERAMAIVTGIGENADRFVRLFRRLDALSTRRRGPKKVYNLKRTIRGALDLYSTEIDTNGVEVTVHCPDESPLLGWDEDIHIILVQLIDNSLYWMKQRNVENPQILIDIQFERDVFDHLDYRDTGPGIDRELISEEVIFEPYFSTKAGGTGLGLAIAGEAAHTLFV